MGPCRQPRPANGTRVTLGEQRSKTHCACAHPPTSPSMEHLPIFSDSKRDFEGPPRTPDHQRLPSWSDLEPTPLLVLSLSLLDMCVSAATRGFSPGGALMRSPLMEGRRAAVPPEAALSGRGHFLWTTAAPPPDESLPETGGRNRSGALLPRSTPPAARAPTSRQWLHAEPSTRGTARLCAPAPVSICLPACPCWILAAIVSALICLGLGTCSRQAL